MTDARGTVIPAIVNEVGNFYGADFSSPYRARVLYQGRERRMISSQTNPDCNSCHTQAGTNGAPGRIVLP